MSPIHQCKNAMDDKYECNYAICNNCFESLRTKETEPAPERTRTKERRNKGSLYINKEDSFLTVNEKCKGTDCEHNLNNLESFRDGIYFKQNFLDKKKEKMYPFSCNNCKCVFTDKNIYHKKVKNKESTEDARLEKDGDDVLKSIIV